MAAPWTSFGLRAMPPLSARARIDGLPGPLGELLGDIPGAAAAPLVGITSDGTVRPGLYPRRSTGVPTAAILGAAQAILGTLDAAQRAKVTLRLDCPEQRSWLNIHPNVLRHGLMLEPSRSHIHSILRASNGGDYGADLLRQHHERFEHSGGLHTVRG